MNVFTPEKCLETPRLVLDPLLPEHALLIYDQLLDLELYKYIPQNPPNSLQELEKRYEHLAFRKSPDGQELWLNWVARLREPYKYIGTFQATVYANRCAEIAYMVFVPFWQHGYGKEGCQRLLRHLVLDYQVEVIAAEIDTRNVASIHLAEAIGMQRVSFTRNADYFKQASSDEYRYEVTRSTLEEQWAKEEK